VIIEKTNVNFIMCMGKIKNYIFYVSFLVVCVSAQTTRIDMSSQIDEDEITIKERELEERRQSIELMKIEAEMDAEARALQDSIRLKQYYGYDFFQTVDDSQNDDEQYENLPIPKGYVVGPGDNIEILLWGQTQLQVTYPVNRDGRIFVPEIGPINVSGKTLDELRPFLRDQFVKIYSTINSRTDRTYLDVTLGALESINLQVVGEVGSPGIHTIHPFSTITTALTQAGGLDTTGSLRSIRVIRDDKLHAEIDLYDLMMKGDQSSEFRLRESDLILVPIRLTKLTISGEVYRPGIYEMKPGETIQQLIEYAGGLKSTASSIVELQRITPFNDRMNDDDIIDIDYLNYKAINSKEIADGDIIKIHRIMPVNKEVVINGQIKRPGVYAFHDSLSLKRLLDLSGGINDPDFIRSVNLSKIDITRRDPDSDYSEVISFSLEEFLDGTIKPFYMENHDQVTIYPNLKYLPARTVEISGEILLPGVYPILGDFETINSIVERAGGFTSRAFKEGTELIRDEQRLVIEEMSNTMKDGDIITVPEKSDVVNVTGAIYNPGLISFKKGRTVSQYIRLSGGMTPDGNKNDLIVIYADGRVVPKRAYINPKPAPGCTIQVNSRPIQTPVEQLLVFVNGISNTMTQLLTTYIVLSQLGTIFGG